MLIVEYKLATASWDAPDREWKSDDEDFADALNENIPRGIDAPNVPFLLGGEEGVALEGAKKVFGDELKVILFEPRPVPAEQEGTCD